MVTIKSKISREGRTVLLPNGKEYTFSPENTIEVEEDDVESLTSNPDYNLFVVSTSGAPATKTEKTVTGGERKTGSQEPGGNLGGGASTVEEIKKALTGKKNDELKTILTDMGVEASEFQDLVKADLVELILLKTTETEQK